MTTEILINKHLDIVAQEYPYNRATIEHCKVTLQAVIAELDNIDCCDMSLEGWERLLYRKAEVYKQLNEL